jgi:hypothetical protein
VPVIPAIQEADIRKIVVQSHPGQIVHETLSRKTLHKNRAGLNSIPNTTHTKKRIKVIS